MATSSPRRSSILLGAPFLSSHVSFPPPPLLPPHPFFSVGGGVRPTPPPARPPFIGEGLIGRPPPCLSAIGVEGWVVLPPPLFIGGCLRGPPPPFASSLTVGVGWSPPPAVLLHWWTYGSGRTSSTAAVSILGLTATSGAVSDGAAGGGTIPAGKRGGTVLGTREHKRGKKEETHELNQRQI